MQTKLYTFVSHLTFGASWGYPGPTWERNISANLNLLLIKTTISISDKMLENMQVTLRIPWFSLRVLDESFIIVYNNCRLLYVPIIANVHYFATYFPNNSLVVIATVKKTVLYPRTQHQVTNRLTLKLNTNLPYL